MKPLLYLLAVACLTLGATVPCSAQPPEDAQVVSPYKVLDRLMSVAGYPDSVRTRLTAQSLSRLEAAMVLNQVMLDIEDAGRTLEPDLMYEVRLLTEELRDEISVLQLRQSVEAQGRTLDSLSRLVQRPSLSGGLRFYAERLDGSLPVSPAEADFYGQPPKKTRLLLAQELVLEAGTKIGSALDAFLSLRNFGYWGVGKYSSGSTGIGFSTAGPLFIDQAWMDWRQRGWRLRLGRQLIRYGSIGLLVDHRYSPVLGFSVGLDSGETNASLLLASQFQGLEYYAGRLRRDFGSMAIGGHYFISDYDPSQKEMLSIEDDQGAGVDIVGAPWGKKWALEMGLYKPHSHPPLLSHWHFGWAAAGDILNSSGWRINLNLGSISKSFLPSLPPVDRFSLDFPSTEFNRIIYGTRGFNLFLARVIGPWSLEAESLLLDYLQSPTNLARLSLRTRWQKINNISIIFEDVINRRAGKTYNQISLLTSFKL